MHSINGTFSLEKETYLCTVPNEVKLTTAQDSHCLIKTVFCIIYQLQKLKLIFSVLMEVPCKSTNSGRSGLGENAVEALSRGVPED
jgi:hypothetical protein